MSPLPPLHGAGAGGATGDESPVEFTFSFRYPIVKVQTGLTRTVSPSVKPKEILPQPKKLVKLVLLGFLMYGAFSADSPGVSPRLDTLYRIHGISQISFPYGQIPLCLPFTEGDGDASHPPDASPCGREEITVSPPWDVSSRFHRGSSMTTRVRRKIPLSGSESHSLPFTKGEGDAPAQS